MTQRRQEYSKNFEDFNVPEVYSDDEVVGSDIDSPYLKQVNFGKIDDYGDGGETMESDDD